MTPIAPVVSVAWFRARLAEPDPTNGLVVCDARAYLDGRRGLDAYRAGHLPGARFLDLDTALAGPPGPVVGRHPLPDPAVFAAALAAEGIGEQTTVVAYDDAGGMMAARLVWMLRILDGQAALLDGGLDAWLASGGSTETGDAPPAITAQRIARPWPREAMVDADGLAAHLATGGVVIDARAAERFRGEVEPLDPRAGHVPGARNLPFTDNLDRGQFRPTAELAQRFDAAGVNADTICYCGSGVSACHNILAAELAGRGRPRLYVASWSGWSSDPARPVATGPDPGQLPADT